LIAFIAWSNLTRDEKYMFEFMSNFNIEEKIRFKSLNLLKK